MSALPSVRRLISPLQLRDGHSRPRLLYTRQPLSAEVALLVRAAIIIALLSAVLAVLWWDRSGLRDTVDREVSFEDYRMERLQRRLEQHIVIVGYGGSGSTAAQELVSDGADGDW